MIQELSYIGIASPRSEDWRAYGTRQLGAMLTDDGPDGAVRLAVDDVSYRIAVHPGEQDEFLYAGWGMANETDLQSFVEKLETHGVVVHTGDATLLAERQVAELSWFEDPWGIRHELSWGKLATPLSFTPGRPMRGGFVTGDQGLGHVVFQVPDLDEANRFYVDVLGFRLSDRIATDRYTVRFYHVNGRHHSLALAELPGYVGFNHLMLEVENIDDLGTAIDLLDETGTEVMQTLGRHTNDLMTSIYISSPSGLQIEYGHGGLVVDDLSWIARTYDQPSYWGHRRPASSRSRVPGIVRPAPEPADANAAIP
ncbi:MULTISPECIES: VOC family protein [unclassified Rhodococcus (in: high G+C Gram-positive bacteria)]|uniref:VOC family protein n=1 Tax=unclassified Rhodococcus (in: high G+C Gram-positive bacteria) TaxID=192944 RepID=UPI001583A866|nr:VOC family protein [Rhodococcus sp. W8901]QKT13334.1 VOC family protein [Rhodococcus sp. W8901]